MPMTGATGRVSRASSAAELKTGSAGRMTLPPVARLNRGKAFAGPSPFRGRAVPSSLLRFSCVFISFPRDVFHAN
jgi:hypothetical protein